MGRKKKAVTKKIRDFNKEVNSQIKAFLSACRRGYWGKIW